MPHTYLNREKDRIRALHSTGLLDSVASEGFDRITRLASQIFTVPIALVSLVDEDRQWFKSRVGMESQETPRDVAFCSHTIEQSDVMVVPDAQLDARFFDNPLVVGDPNIRFYASAPLVLASGHAIGGLCLIDREPRTFSAAQQRQLKDLAAMVMVQIDLQQRAGCINEVTRLPNRAQLTQDLADLCRSDPGSMRTMVLLDVMSHAQLQSAVRAVGIAPLEASLREIAAKLSGMLGTEQTLYHVSETRFSFLLSGERVQDSSLAAGIVNRMRDPFQSRGISVELEVVAGLTDIRLQEDLVVDGLRRATSALHQAISTQVNWMWHEVGSDDRHRRRFSLLHDIQRGLSEGEFRLVYQPKLNLRTGVYAGVEALARWEHHRYGAIAPAEFIPLIENTTLIHQFTEWVLHTALAQLAQWEIDGIALSMAVNVSSKNLDHADFVKVLMNAYKVHGIEPSRLHVECTENAALTGPATKASLDCIKALGIQISLDDFGIGFCNLACLHDLPVELLKLDQSLVRPISTDQRALILVRSLISLGHNLGYRLLGEGVETKEIFDLLQSAGCDAIQGYYLSRPLEAEGIPDFLQLHAYKNPLAGNH